MKKRLDLSQIKVESFVTSFDRSEDATQHLKGGAWTADGTCHNSCGPVFTVHYGNCGSNWCT